LSLSDLSKGNLEKVKAEIESLGAKVMITVVDVTKREQVEGWIKATVDAFGRLDGALNSAGVAPGSGKVVSELDDKGRCEDSTRNTPLCVDNDFCETEWNFIIVDLEELSMSMLCGTDPSQFY
jgi:NAD(P)-dependent dehydrogenase (short-subunit alcohol dehydrogenase family)